MPITWEALTKRLRYVEGEYEGDSWAIGYYPHKMTDPIFAAMNEFRRESGFASLNQILAELIGHWDFTFEGLALPINEDTFSMFPVLLKMDMITKIMDDYMRSVDPNSSTESSPAGSPPTELSVGATPGTSTFAPADTPVSLLGPSPEFPTPRVIRPGQTGS